MNNIPFDNLYKFMAISGLVCLIAIAGYWHHEEEQRVLESYDYLYEVMEINVELKYLLEYLQYYREIEQDETEAKKFFIDKTKEIDIRSLQKEKAQDLKEYYDGLAGVYGISLFIGFLLSSSLSISGFSLWYYKVQRFQDAELSDKSTNEQRQSDA
jgi:hypothetical protein